jgi:uncharacterized integral membrane protein
MTPAPQYLIWLSVAPGLVISIICLYILIMSIAEGDFYFYWRRDLPFVVGLFGWVIIPWIVYGVWSLPRVLPPMQPPVERVEK